MTRKYATLIGGRIGQDFEKNFPLHFFLVFLAEFGPISHRKMSVSRETTLKFIGRKTG